jgi:hypothetical protein
MLAPQVSFVGQVVPQFRMPLHPSLAMPQSKPRLAQVPGVQFVLHTLGLIPLPLQVSGAVQVPQSRMLPQPSPIMPQFLPCWAQLMYAAHGIPPSGTPESPPVPVVMKTPVDPPPPLFVPEVLPPFMDAVDAEPPWLVVTDPLPPHEAVATTTEATYASKAQK